MSHTLTPEHWTDAGLTDEGSGYLADFRERLS